MTLVLSSSSFQDQGMMPAKHTCEGADLSPALQWSGAPEGTKSYALIVDDPDAPDPAAPRMVYVHWVLYNIPASAPGLPEGVSALPTGARQGLNDWGNTGYGGPCPPIGVHRYFFKLYALDAVLKIEGAPNKNAILQAMQGHVLSEAQIVGTYIKAKKEGA